MNDRQQQERDDFIAEMYPYDVVFMTDEELYAAGFRARGDL